ncbi:hypothetical protein R50072_19030 [Simiduia litorea]|uniref:FliO/MopB family protein n=1 Tax=Simiduia litorea TaxID=1435348 RepID=UPI0036F3F701
MKTELQPITDSANSLLVTAPATAMKAQTTADMAVQLVQVLGSLGLVIGLIFLVAYLVKRNQGFTTSTRQLKIIERLALSNKDQLVLVSLRGKDVLLGVSSAGVHTLLTLDEENAPATTKGVESKTDLEPSERTKNQLKSGNFAHHLQQILATRMAS